MMSNKWLVGLLLVSVTLNIAAVGFIAGRASGAGLRPPLADPLMGVGGLVRELPEARRRELMADLRALRHNLRPPIRDMRRAQLALEEALLAPEVERARLTSALEAFRDNLCNSMARSNESFVDLASRLTPGEREMLLERMARRDMHRSPRDHGRRPPPPAEPPRR